MSLPRFCRLLALNSASVKPVLEKCLFFTLFAINYGFVFLAFSLDIARRIPLRPHEILLLSLLIDILFRGASWTLGFPLIYL